MRLRPLDASHSLTGNGLSDTFIRYPTVPIDIRRNTAPWQRRSSSIQFGGGVAETSVTSKDILGGKGAGPHGDDQDRPPGPGRLHDRHPRLRGVLQGQPQAPQGHRRRGQGRPGQAREGRRQEARRLQGSPARLRPLRRRPLDARHDGDHPQPRPQRQVGRGPRRQDRQSPLRLRQLPPLHPDVLHHRHGPLQGAHGGDALAT